MYHQLLPLDCHEPELAGFEVEGLVVDGFVEVEGFVLVDGFVVVGLEGLVFVEGFVVVGFEGVDGFVVGAAVTGVNLKR